MYIGMERIGKKVPDKNIIGKIMTCAMILEFSTFFATIPMTIPNEAKNMGPRIRNGMSQNDKKTCAPKPNVPTPTISTKEITLRKIYQSIFEISHSPLERGVSESCLKILSFLYNEDTLTSENIGLVRMENPMRPGTKKSMYVSDCPFTVVWYMPTTGEPPTRLRLNSFMTALTVPLSTALDNAVGFP